MEKCASPSIQKLIALIEAEMLTDVSAIDVPSKDENKVDLECVRTWYFETEKLLRVIGNVFSSPMSQSINQLRYAGHHIIKADIEEDPTSRKQNIIEAYKHCKRAYYDALDLYVHKLAEDYKVLLPYLDTQSASKLERTLREHLQEIQTSRLNNESRIEYYKDVQSTLIRGLEIIEEFNEVLRETGMSRSLYARKAALIQKVAAQQQDINTQQQHINTLKNSRQSLQDSITNKSYNVALTVTIIIALATAIGLVADAFVTSRHDVQMVIQPSPENLDIPLPAKTEGKAKGSASQ